MVTGAGSGIGNAIAERLVGEGAIVSLWDINKASLSERATKQGSVHSVEVDISDANQVADAMTETAREFGKIDILVASAGITGPNVTTWEYPVNAWNKVIEVNLNGLFYCNRAVVSYMQSNNYGRIVNIASVAGKEGNPNASAYSASKAGVIGLTKSLGKELARTNIRVNCVTPAAVRTPIFQQMTQSHIDFMVSKIPIGRFGEIDEVASLVCWLASEECSFSTGAVFDVSGGRATY